MDLPRGLLALIEEYISEALDETGTRKPTQPDEPIDDVARMVDDDNDTVIAPLPRRRAPHSTADLIDDEITIERYRPSTVPG